MRAGDLWATPQWLFDRLDVVLSFELDAAADETNAKCEAYHPEPPSFFRERPPWWSPQPSLPTAAPQVATRIEAHAQHPDSPPRWRVAEVAEVEPREV